MLRHIFDFSEFGGQELLTIFIGLVMPLILWFISKWWRIGPNGKHELRRIYWQSAIAIVTNRQELRTVKKVIYTPEFFEQLALREDVTRHQERNAFELHLQRWWPTRAEETITGVVDRIYAEILERLRHAKYPAWVKRAEKWDDELGSGTPLETEDPIQAIQTQEVHRAWKPGYVAVVITDDPLKSDEYKADAKTYFSSPAVRIPEIPRSSITFVGTETPSIWDEQLVRVTGAISKLKKKEREIHLVCIARSLWCYALGVKLQVDQRMVLYHYEDATYHRIWNVNRKIKNQKGPVVNPDHYEYQVCGAPRLVVDGSNPNRVVLGLAIGSHRDILAAFEGYRAENLPDAPVWEIRRHDLLSPCNPNEWISAASDLAVTIDSLSAGGVKEVYLFGILPATLAIMTGSTVGPYRNVHLLQFDGTSYIEMMHLLPRTVSNQRRT